MFDIDDVKVFVDTNFKIIVLTNSKQPPKANRSATRQTAPRQTAPPRWKKF